MQEVSLFPWWVPAFLTIWGIVGPIVGLAFGNYLSASAQRKRWVADNQKEEYRKLLGALTRFNMVMSAYQLTKQFHEAEVRQVMEEVTMAAGTSIFISDFLESTKVIGELKDAAGAFARGEETFEQYQRRHWKAVNQILTAAKKIKL